MGFALKRFRKIVLKQKYSCIRDKIISRVIKILIDNVFIV